MDKTDTRLYCIVTVLDLDFLDLFLPCFRNVPTQFRLPVLVVSRDHVESCEKTHALSTTVVHGSSSLEGSAVGRPIGRPSTWFSRENCSMKLTNASKSPYSICKPLLLL